MMRLLGFAATASVAYGANLLDSKNRPVTKVINLLKEMQANLEKEGDEDEAVYNKLACWCETNDKVKTQAIKEAEEKIDQLTAKIAELLGASARLSSEIKQLENEVENNQKALDQATEIRTKEKADFNADEKDTLQSISALKSAVTVLSKHHKNPEALIHVQNLIKYQVAVKDMYLLPAQKKALDAFVQEPDFMNAEPTFKQSYAPQSGEIFGILESMLDTFKANLSQSQKDEMASQEAYDQMKAAKEDEIKNGQTHAARKKQERATADEDRVNAKEDLKDTEASLSADEKYLMDLKEKCAATDAEWENRSKTRREEIQAVSDALEVLTGDDAHDTFSATFNAGFLQTTTSDETVRREHAAKVLASAAARLNNPGLSALATTVRLDAFTKVKAAIDEMIEKLLKEKADEIKHKDFCNGELNENSKQNQLKENKKGRLESEIDNLDEQIKTLANEIDTLNSEIKELQKQSKRAGENREAENMDYQHVVEDQRATVQLLKLAMDKLKGFYQKKDALVQAEPVGPPPPPDFKEYKKQGGAGGVMGLLEQIISDTKVMEAEANQAEKDAQTAYEAFHKDSFDQITNKSAAVADKTAVKAEKEKTRVATKEERDATIDELETLSDQAAALHTACDFVLKNFDVRQTARDEEVEALRQAKSILSGADFSAFLQRRF